MKTCLLTIMLAALFISLSAPRAFGAEQVEQLYVPETIVAPPWIAERGAAQIAGATELDVFYDFSFADELERSGIDFHHGITDESGKHWQPVHYDHGNGVAIADVDGNGWLDIYFTTQAGGNELWQNLGEGRFSDITDSAAVAVTKAISVGASFADIDNDSDADLFVTTIRAGNIMFANDGEGHFRDVSDQVGLNYKGHSSAGLFFDYDRDGQLDLFLTNVGRYTNDVAIGSESRVGHQKSVEYEYFVGLTEAFGGHLKPDRSEQSILYHNENNSRFADVSSQMGLQDVSWSGDATSLDANEDGWPDLYVLNMQGHDHYYQNISGEEFVDRSGDLFPHTPWGAMGIVVFDYDNDSDMDIFVTDMHSDMSEDIGTLQEKLKANMTYPESFLQSGGRSIYGNAFFRNLGDGHYEEISDQVGTENYWPWGLSVGDLNADGYQDVFVASSMNYPFRYAVNSVLLNKQGTGFADAEFVLGVEPRRGGRTAQPWFELDCANEDRNHRHCEGRSGAVVVWGALGSRASAISDLDADGDLDIVTNEFNAPPLVLISDLAQKQEIHFLKIDLQGSTSNRSGLGAIVTVRAGSQTYVQVRDGKSGYLSQSLYPLYFGLGMVETVDRIMVAWPSGNTQVINGPLDTNRLMVIQEP